jgi:hypothetical protein
MPPHLFEPNCQSSWYGDVWQHAAIVGDLAASDSSEFFLSLLVTDV